MNDTSLCYNQINGCTNKRGAEFRGRYYQAFCSEKCWAEYNNVDVSNNDKPKGRKTFEDWIKDFKSRNVKKSINDIFNGEVI